MPQTLRPQSSQRPAKPVLAGLGLTWQAIFDTFEGMVALDHLVSTFAARQILLAEVCARTRKLTDMATCQPDADTLARR